MQEILAKRSGLDPEQVRVECEPKTEPLPLARIQWQPPVRTGERSGYILSQCGKWSISKDLSGETVSYTAWRCATQKYDQPTHLGVRNSADEAKLLCEADDEAS